MGPQIQERGIEGQLYKICTNEKVTFMKIDLFCWKCLVKVM